MNHAPVFTSINQNGAINQKLSAQGAPIFIKPVKGMRLGQRIEFTYEAYDKLDEGDKKFVWTFLSQALTERELRGGYHLNLPREQLIKHCFGHGEAFYVIHDEQQPSHRSHIWVDLRHGGSCE